MASVTAFYWDKSLIVKSFLSVLNVYWTEDLDRNKNYDGAIP
jgi:hypothetical protein